MLVDLPHAGGVRQGQPIHDGQGRREDADHAIGAVEMLFPAGCEAVRAGEMQFLAEEFLPAAVQQRQVARSARVDHAGRLDARAVAEHHGSRPDADRLAAGKDALGRQRRAHDPVEPFGGDRAISRSQQPAMGGEDDMVAEPAIRHERLDQRPVAFRHILVEEGPDVIAAERPAAIDQQQPHLRTQPGQRVRDQAAGEPASDDREVTLARRVHRRCLAGMAPGVTLSDPMSSLCLRSGARRRPRHVAPDRVDARQSG